MSEYQKRTLFTAACRDYERSFWVHTFFRNRNESAEGSKERAVDLACAMLALIGGDLQRSSHQPTASLVSEGERAKIVDALVSACRAMRHEIVAVRQDGLCLDERWAELIDQATAAIDAA